MAENKEYMVLWVDKMAEQTKQMKTSRKKIIDYVDIETLKEILEAFTTTTGLMANIVDVEGVSIFPREGVNKCCKFCRIIYGLEGGKKRCCSAYKRAGKQAALFGEPYIFRCPSGLIEWAAPLILNEEHVGTIICGQVLMWEPEEFFWIELREMNKSLTSDFKELFAAVEELPVISGHQVQASAYLLYVVANYIMKAGWENYEQVKELAKQQSQYVAEIENRKILEKQAGEDAAYPLIDENEIILQLRKNQVDSKNYFQTVISRLRFESNHQMGIMQAKMTELLVILSRAVNQMGFDPTQFMDINHKYILRFYKTESADNLSVLVSKAIDQYLDRMQKLTEKPLTTNAKMIIDYIEKNYRKNLTLEDISDAVCLSSGYAGRLFKEQTGMPIMDYVTKVRMEKAKKLLLKPHYQIQTIAESVGYSDLSYFTKVFKRVEGLTPSQFRKYHNR